MQHPWLAGLLALLLSMAAGLSQAQIGADTAEQLMRKSGLWQQLATLGPQVRAGLQAVPGLKAEEQQRLGRSVDTAFAPDPVRASALRVLTDGLSPSLVPPLLAWFDSALGRRITALEEASAASGADPTEALREGAALLDRATPERRQLLGRIVELTQAPEAAVSMMINTALAIQQGVASVAPAMPGPSRQELKAGLEGQRASMRRAFEGVMLAAFARAYETLPDAELAAYAEFIGTPGGRHFNDVATRAVERAMVDGAQALGRSLPGAKAGANT